MRAHSTNGLWGSPGSLYGTKLLADGSGPPPGAQGAPAPAQPAQGAPAPSGEGAPAGGGGGMGSGVVTMLMFLLPVALLLFMSRSQSKKQKQLESSIKVGDRVVLQAGLIGKIIELRERVVTLEIAPGVNVKALKTSIQGHEADVNKPEPAKDEKKDDKKDDKKDAEEAPAKAKK
jgi:preprotein translocase subunit YajC